MFNPHPSSSSTSGVDLVLQHLQCVRSEGEGPSSGDSAPALRLHPARSDRHPAFRPGVRRTGRCPLNFPGSIPVVMTLPSMTPRLCPLSLALPPQKWLPAIASKTFIRSMKLLAQKKRHFPELLRMSMNSISVSKYSSGQ